MRVLITGSSGLLGRAVLRSLPASVDVLAVSLNRVPDVAVRGLSKTQLNIVDRESVMQCVDKYKPQVIVHMAAMGDVDFCEKNPETCFRVNVDGTQNLIDAAQSSGARFLFTSSNAVYDGKNAPYDEDSRLSPITVYGRAKAEAEERLKKSDLEWAVLRPILMYGVSWVGGRKNPFSWIVESLREGKRLKVVDDVFCNPLYSGSGADAVWRAIAIGAKGVFNIAGAERLSRYQLSVQIAEEFELDTSLIEPVSSSFFSGIAGRPVDTTFVTSKMERELGIRPKSVLEGLKSIKREI